MLLCGPRYVPASGCRWMCDGTRWRQVREFSSVAAYWQTPADDKQFATAVQDARLVERRSYCTDKLLAGWKVAG